MLNIPSTFQSFDDLLHDTYESIVKNGIPKESKRGPLTYIYNFGATLEKPKSRTSRSLNRKLVRSKFAEFAWYLSGEADVNFISPYISRYEQEDQKDGKVLGAYGPKIFGRKERFSQFERVIRQLEDRPNTKQALMVISEIQDYGIRTNEFSSPPCTIGLHFLIRNERLDLVVYMRSNDAFYGLPHDLFCFTMLQELVACRIGKPMGSYTHYSTSMHVYKDHLEKVKDYLKEGLHDPIEMPPMVNGDDHLLKEVANEFHPHFLECESKITDQYWKDYVLFSSKHWKADEAFVESRFHHPEMKEIALNSITL